MKSWKNQQNLEPLCRTCEGNKNEILLTFPSLSFLMSENGS